MSGSFRPGNSGPESYGGRPGVGEFFSRFSDSESLDTKRANHILGRLLQVNPDVPLEHHMNTARQGIDAVSPKRGVGGFANDTIFGVSDAVADSHGRPYIVIEPTGGLNYGVFYLSNSHAVWRAMLAKAFDGYIAKGMFGAENSADAPIRLQKAFSGIAEVDVPKNAAATDIIYALVNNQIAGSPQVADSDAESKMRRAGVSAEPKFSEADILSAEPGELFTEAKRPEFDETTDEWTSSHPLYGEIHSLVVPSVDGTMNYLVNSADSNGTVQRWVGTAEVAGSYVTELALPRDFPEIPEELLEPPIDYGDSYDSGYQPRREEPSRFEQFAVAAGLG